jgi:hypothetical protein
LQGSCTPPIQSWLGNAPGIVEQANLHYDRARGIFLGWRRFEDREITQARKEPGIRAQKIGRMERVALFRTT